MARGDDSRLYARCYCDSRKELEYGHGIVSSVRSSVCLSSLVQAIAYYVVHPFGALGDLYSVLCWSFSSWCNPLFFTARYDSVL
jgi:hypothetical protein